MRDSYYIWAASSVGLMTGAICYGRGWAWLPGLMFCALALGVIIDHRRKRCAEAPRTRRRRRKPAPAKLKVGEYICDIDGEGGLDGCPAQTTCDYRSGAYDRCDYDGECSVKVEVTERDAEEHPDIIEKEED